MLADQPRIDALTVSNVAVTLGGVATILVPFLDSNWQFIVYCILFGFGVGSYFTNLLVIDNEINLAVQCHTLEN